MTWIEIVIISFFVMAYIWSAVRYHIAMKRLNDALKEYEEMTATHDKEWRDIKQEVWNRHKDLVKSVRRHNNLRPEVMQ
ncbi:MAG: hypothetical protein GWN93_26850 [Deltaproteobacteria bacterium]|nr:hypothetical protein [Deltaproteobacteria bacterium]